MELNTKFKITKTKNKEVKEKTIENKIKSFLQSKNIFYYKTFGSQYTINGLPDIIAVINGYFVGIEVKKSKTGKLSKAQELIAFEIIKNNGIWLVADNLEIVKLVVDDILLNNKEDLKNILGYDDIKSFITYITKKGDKL